MNGFQNKFHFAIWKYSEDILASVLRIIER